MLDFLVTSKVRRRLLGLLWGGEAPERSVAELADAAGVGVASAYRELEAMTRHGLVTTAYKGGREVFSANHEHPAASALRLLVSSRQSQTRRARDVDGKLYGQLRSLGAPLPTEATTVSDDEREEVLVRGVKASHSDPRLARALPRCFWSQRNCVDVDRLLAAAKNHREKNAVGFFLGLTAELSDDDRFAQWSRLFRDHRVRAREFFVGASTKAHAKLTDANTPDVARAWGFRMNLDLSSFRSLFDKFDDAQN